MADVGDTQNASSAPDPASQDDQNDQDDQNAQNDQNDQDDPVDQNDIQRLLAALVEQARALATRIAGTPDRETNCHFCEAPLPLWENLLVLQLTGVAAHVECPIEALDAKLQKVGPLEEFPYQDFSEAVQRRLQTSSPTSRSGTIERTPPSNK